LGGKAIDNRIMTVTVGFGLILAALTARLFYLQIVEHRHLVQLAQRQQERSLEIQPARGKIFDRQGRLLAFNRECASFFAVPEEIRDPAATARKLESLTGVSSATLLRHFRSRKNFVWIRRKVPDAAAAAITRLNLPGVYSLPETQRVYPEGRLACHVLGFVGVDNQGLAGVEVQFDRSIRGQKGWMRLSRDAHGRVVPTSNRILQRPEPGQDLVLTLDKVVQHVAERELARTVEHYRARSGSVVVLDPGTGEILALANSPDYDPNRFGAYPAASRRDRAVRDVFEPGSTFKLVVAGAALEEGVFSENDIVDCEQGLARFHGRVVRDHEPHGRITFQEVVEYSSNIGAVKIGLKLGAERLAHYARSMGFGRRTGIELPGEAEGLMRIRGNSAALTSVPFGQGVAVSAIQLAMAYAMVANDGWLLKPTVVKELRGPAGVTSNAGGRGVREQVLSAKSARRLREILTRAVEIGTGVEARVANYRVAGKTGTAQKPLQGGRGYDPVHHVASFVGFLPADRPRLLIAVVIDSPHGPQWGGVVAGPVFKAVTQNLVAYLGIPPAAEKVFRLAREDKPQAPSVADLKRVPDFRGREPGAAKAELRRLGLNPACLGQGSRVLGQLPEAGALVRGRAPVVLYLSQAEGDDARGLQPPKVVVPNLSGQSLRDALQVLSTYGLQARIIGSGVVQSQTPQAESWLRVDAVCTLHCQDPEVVP